MKEMQRKSNIRNIKVNGWKLMDEIDYTKKDDDE